MPEKWKPIHGYEGKYEVSSDGRVRGCQRTVGASCGKTKVLKPRVLSGYAATSGHIYVDLYWERQRHKYGVHTLVAKAFIGPPPGGHECCHIDGNPANNEVQNLYWGTRSDNMLDAVGHGTHNNARKTACPAGHPYSPDNTYNSPSGGRICRTCSAEAKRAYESRKAAHHG